MPRKNYAGNDVPMATAEDGTNARIVKMGIDLMAMPPVNLKEPEEVRQRIVEFFNYFHEHDMKPGPAALATAMHTDRRVLWSIAHDQPGFNSYPPEVHRLVREAYQFMDANWEAWMLTGKLNPACGIFLGKNNFGYTDTVTVRHEEESGRPLEAIEADYKELPD